jgi:hypothetical protein
MLLAVRRLGLDDSRDVLLQLAIAATKIDGPDPLPWLIEVLARGGDDKLIPHIVWQYLHPLLEKRSQDFLKLVRNYDLNQTPEIKLIVPRVTDRILARDSKATLMPAVPQPNPYESPTSSPAESTAGLDEQARIEQLEHRLNELERRINRSGLLSGNFAIRSLVVFGHAVLAYLVVAGVAYGLLAIFFFAMSKITAP